MINDLDETLKQLLIGKVPLDPVEVDISFDMPDREWSASVVKPTVNLYLYDIHENLELRSNEWMIERSQGIATRKKPPVRVDLSYLITVWTSDTADQHRLLGQLLATLFRYQELPEDLLQGSLKEARWPLRTFTAQKDGILINAADFWSALDNQIRPSINYVVTIPVEIEAAVAAPLVVTKVAEYRKDGETADKFVHIRGTVHARGKPEEVVADAMVVVKELQMTATTDEEGKYSLRRLGWGSYTFEVSAPGQKKREVQITVPSPGYDIEL